MTYLEDNAAGSYPEPAESDSYPPYSLLLQDPF
jgi:hypothetical protein